MLRDAPVGPPGHGSELSAFLPIVHGQPVLYAGQDRYAAYELLGADTHVPLVEFPDEDVTQNLEKPFDTGDAYSPIDFDSFSRSTLNRFPYVITGRAAWNSEAPPDFRRDRRDPLLRPLGTDGAAARTTATCCSRGPSRRRSPTAPRRRSRILTAEPGPRLALPGRGDRPETDWAPDSVLGTGESATQTLDLPAGRWLPLAPVLLALRPDPERARASAQPLPAALDGQRPNTISLANNGQFWPAGEIESDGGPVEFTLSAAEASGIQSLTGYDGKASIGELVAVRDAPHRIVPLRRGLRRTGSTGTSPDDRRPDRAGPGAAQTALAARRSGRTRTTSQTSASLLEAVDDQRRDVELPAAEAVGRRRSGRRGGCCARPRRRSGSRSARGCATRRRSRSRGCRRRGRAS